VYTIVSVDVIVALAREKVIDGDRSADSNGHIRVSWEDRSKGAADGHSNKGKSEAHGDCVVGEEGE
jgi:hypothetical protein